jgi:hypothetical protein
MNTHDNDQAVFYSVWSGLILFWIAVILLTWWLS